VFTLDDYVASGIMQRGQAEVLRLAVEKRTYEVLSARQTSCLSAPAYAWLPHF